MQYECLERLKHNERRAAEEAKIVERFQSFRGSRASQAYLTSDAGASNVMSHLIPTTQSCQVLGCLDSMKYVCKKKDCKRSVCQNHGQAHPKHAGADIKWKDASTSTTSTTILSDEIVTSTPSVIATVSKCECGECNDDAVHVCENDGCRMHVCTLHGPSHNKHEYWYNVTANVMHMYDRSDTQRIEKVKATRLKKKQKT